MRTIVIFASAALLAAAWSDSAAANEDPVATPRKLAVAEDGSLPITLHGTDADGEIASYAVVADPEHGALSGVAPELTYSPQSDYFGADAVQFTVTDDDGATSEPATIAIEVVAVNDFPVASAMVLHAEEDAALHIELEASDRDGTIERFEIVSPPGNGELSGLSGDERSLVYLPHDRFFGHDSFEYRARDDEGAASDPAEVAITVLSGPYSLERKRALIRASRLASRATLGMSFEEIAAMADRGLENWLDNQLGMAKTSLLARVDQLRSDWELGRLSHYGAARKIPSRYLWSAQWQVAMTAPDQLAQRVTLALSEILVVSATENALNKPDPIAAYSDILLEHCFGSFGELLFEVTRSPAMGFFLSHMHNRKADPGRNIHPDENYAREVMQLFTIGLYELNLDGSRKLDAGGDPIPAYDAEDVRNFARAFTGLGMDNGLFKRRPEVWRRPMRMYGRHHDTGEKTLLNGTVLPANQAPMTDIRMALDNLAEHPNTAPFISRQLIQRLVTSNPSPDYVERVARVFESDRDGRRGNLGAVVKAILLDPEADRLPQHSEQRFGKLREPALRQLQLARQFNAISEDGYYWTGTGMAAGQFFFRAPSVFNFFLPTHVPSAAFAEQGLAGPEFQIADENNLLRLVNWYARSLNARGNIMNSFGMPGTWLDVSSYLPLADDVGALLHRLNLVMTYGQLSRTTEAVVRSAISRFKGSAEKRVRLAIFLIANSPDYAVET